MTGVATRRGGGNESGGQGARFVSAHDEEPAGAEPGEPRRDATFLFSVNTSCAVAPVPAAGAVAQVNGEFHPSPPPECIIEMHGRRCLPCSPPCRPRPTPAPPFAAPVANSPAPKVFVSGRGHLWPTPRGERLIVGRKAY